MEHVAAGLAFAVFLWWIGTGGILVAAGLSRSALWLAQLVSLPLLAIALGAFDWAAGQPGMEGVYVGFAAAIAIWGWHEFAFLTGLITGPRRAPCPPGASEWRRFACAVAALAWHELALAATAILMIALAWLEPSQFGVWTFLLLLFARVSAKLNVFLGVPNLTEEFLPEPIQHLKSYFRRRPMNLFFPVSITLLMLTVGCFAERAWEAETAADLAGFTLLTTLATLALIEHWLLVLPLRDAALWQWMLPAGDSRRKSLISTDRA